MNKDEAKPTENEEKQRRRDEFKALAEPLVMLIRKKHNPHTTIIITDSGAEILEGVCGVNFDRD